MAADTALQPGTRVALHPGTDRWMRGDRYGAVIREVRTGKRERRALVKMDRSGQTVSVAVSLLDALR